MRFKHILVVCVGNICRSPTAEYLLKKRLSEAGSSATVRSAGLSALVDKGVEANAMALLQEHGVDASEHKARQVNSAMLAEADLVLAMEEGHIRALHQISPTARGKCFLLGKWLNDREIPDPYRQSRAMFESVYDLIDESTEQWQKMIG